MDEVSKCNSVLFKQLIHECDHDVVSGNVASPQNVCLITNEKLEDNSIKLECNHEFNYLSLYNEVIYQKTKKLLDNSRLKINEMKCPYCRNITKMLLPFYKYYSVVPVRGVTYPEEFSMKFHECQHVNVKNGKKCASSACITDNGIFCNKHISATKKENEILANESTTIIDMYNKLKINDLKELLKLNKCRVGGKKSELVNRIIVNKSKKGWVDK